MSDGGDPLESTDARHVTAVHRRNPFAVALTLAVAVLVSGSTLAWLACRASAEDAKRRTVTHLRSELAFRKERVLTHLEYVGRDLGIIASSRLSAVIVGEFTDAIAADGENVYARVRRAYVWDNPNPAGNRQALLSAQDGSTYSEVHARYHDWFLEIARTADHYDIFLTDAVGRVIYSAFKEDDFGTDLVAGAYRDTELARTFERLRSDPWPGRSVFSDFLTYSPSGNLPAAFVGSPILHDGAFAGALIVQLRQQRFDELLGGGQGDGGDVRSYLVGEDGMLRAGTDVPAADVLETAFDTPAATAALGNRSGTLEGPGFGGEEVLSAYAPLRWSGVTWGIVAEIGREDIERSVTDLRRTLALALALCTGLAFVAGWLLADRAEDGEVRARDAL